MEKINLQMRDERVDLRRECCEYFVGMAVQSLQIKDGDLGRDIEKGEVLRIACH